MIKLKRFRLKLRTKPVVDYFSRESLRALYQLGGYIRTIARRSIKQSDGTSQPGRPPYSHTRILRDSIYFSVDRPSGTVVVGPVALQTPGKGYEARGKTIPEALETGGTLIRRSVFGRIGSVPLEPRPFMGPALREAIRSDRLRSSYKKS